MSEKDVKIIAVDDDENIVNSMLMLLEDQFALKGFTDPIEALKYLKVNKQICLVISDFKMPEMNGYEFLKEVQKINSDIYRIILTGYGDVELLVKGVSDGSIQKLLSKPWEPDLLIETILKHFYNIKSSNH